MNPVKNPTTWLNMVWQSDLPSTSKLMCAYLRSYMTDMGNHFAYPSVSTIAKHCNLGRATVQRHLRELSKLGFLLEDGAGPNQATKYRIGQGGPHGEAGLMKDEKGPHGEAQINKEVNNTLSKGRFVPPTLQEVADYIAEMGYSVNAERFHTHYEANNWMRGRTKLKNWKAAVRYWQTNENQKPTARPGAGSSTRDRSIRDDLTDTSWAD